MRKAILSLLLLVSLCSRAQITPVHTIMSSGLYLSGQTAVIHLSQYGDKFVEIHGSYTTTFSGTLHPYPDTIFIYNPDFTFFKKIVLPDSSSRYISFCSPYSATQSTGVGIPSITDNLINNDTLLEYALMRFSHNSSYSTWSILSEGGNVIFTGQLLNASPTLLKMNDKYYIYSDTTIYSLPGSLPCSQCSSFPAGIIEPQGNTGTAVLSVYPNPFNNVLTLEYNLAGSLDNAKITVTDVLGREIQSMKLTNQSDKIVLSTTSLPKGTLIVSLYNNTNDPVSKKVIKIE